MNDESKGGANGHAIWKRGLFMLLFAVIYSIAEIVVCFVVVFQFLCVLITGDKNSRVLELGQSLSAFIYEVLQFVTFNSERMPFPFEAWPGPGRGES